MRDGPDLFSRRMALLNLPINSELQSLREKSGAFNSKDGEPSHDTERSDTPTGAFNSSYDTRQESAILDNYSTVEVSPGTTLPNVEGDSVVTDEIIYIGESNLLTYIASDGAQVSPAANIANLQSNGLTYRFSDDPIESPASTIHTSLYANDAVSYLNNEGAFKFPSRQVMTVLLQAYFRWFHPCFPVVDTSKLSQEYKAARISPMLLQAMLFIGSNYLNDDFFVSSGLISKHKAKSQFYHKAKIIYDTDWESRKTAVVQTLFLISFRRSQASNDKDTRHWLGAAINLAQKQGYHRSCVGCSLFTLTLLILQQRAHHYPRY